MTSPYRKICRWLHKIRGQISVCYVHLTLTDRSYPTQPDNALLINNRRDRARQHLRLLRIEELGCVGSGNAQELLVLEDLKDLVERRSLEERDPPERRFCLRKRLRGDCRVVCRVDVALTPATGERRVAVSFRGLACSYFRRFRLAIGTEATTFAWTFSQYRSNSSNESPGLGAMSTVRRTRSVRYEYEESVDAAMSLKKRE